MIILSDFIHQTTESYSFIRTTQYIYEENNQYVVLCPIFVIAAPRKILELTQTFQKPEDGGRARSEFLPSFFPSPSPTQVAKFFLDMGGAKFYIPADVRNG
jgi:hypothetical protein